MSVDISKALNELPLPSVIEVSDFDTLLSENVAIAKEVLGEKWYPLESDPYMKKLRVITLRQLHNQADKNDTIMNLLVTTASGENLDNIGIDRGVFRDSGEFPYADFKFTLTTPSDGTFVIPKGTSIGSLSNDNKAEVINDIVVGKNELTVTVQVKLLSYGVESEIVLDTLITDLAYIQEVNQLSSFSNGRDAESDDRYRVRIIQSRNQYNTAGCEDSYKYHTYSADNRIDDVVVLDDGEPLEVNVYIASFGGVDIDMIKRVEDALNKKTVRPLGDLVRVAEAPKKELRLSATIEIFDLLKASEIERNIRMNFNDSFFIGQNFTSSDFIRKCHVDGVYRVLSNFDDVVCNRKEIIELKSIDFNFKRSMA